VSAGDVRCPVSWLELERLALGELDATRASAVRAHVAGCDACAACARRIDDDASAPLPALPPRAARGGGAAVTPIGARGAVREPGRGGAFGRVAGALALAASVALFFALRPEEPVDEPRSGAKGGDVTLELAREAGGGTPAEAGVFQDGDRFKVVVSCPPRLRAHWDVVVYDESGASFPLAPAVIACGNGVALPGAFRLTSAREATVCAAWSERGPVARRDLEELAGPGHRDARVCKTLRRGP